MSYTSSICPSAHAPLSEWLTYCERIHATPIDMGLERVRVVAERMRLTNGLGCPVVTVAGTNGKGSTCAMLSAVYEAAGYRCGVYTSPHLVRFEERCRLMGEMVKEEVLVANFAFVERARCQKDSIHSTPISLTYFEFTTLAILLTLSQARLDVVVLEVGLGGRLDAVNVVDADCAVITSVDLDHMELLGNDREAIGFEKAGIMRARCPVVVSDPMPPQTVLSHAATLGADLWRVGHDFSFGGDPQQWGWATSAARGARRYSGLAYPALRGANQLQNAAGVLAVVEVLRARLPVTAQAVRRGLSEVVLAGRFQLVPGQPALVLDVAHNPHSVATLTANLDAMGYYPTTRAVFGAMADKDLAAMIAKVAPIIDHWYFTDLPTPRACTAKALEGFLAELAGRKGRCAGRFESPMSALAAAASDADPTDRIVVFGSFFTVGGVLQNGIPRLAAKRLST